MNADKRSEKFSTNWIIFLMITLVAVMIAGAVLVRGRVDGGGSGTVMTAGIGGGTSHFSNMDITGDLTVGDDLTVTDDVTVAGDLTVGDAITCTSLVSQNVNMSAVGYFTATTSITCSGNITAGVNLRAVGDVSSGDDVTAGDDLIATDDLAVTDDATVSGLMTVGEYGIYSEQTVVVCTEGAPITATGTYQPITSTAAITTSTTCAVYSGTVAGQLVYLVNENASNAIIVDDGANTDLGGNVTLGAGDILKLLWDGANWLGMGTADN